MTRALTWSLPLGILAYMAWFVPHAGTAIAICAAALAVHLVVTWCGRGPVKPKWEDEV